MNGKSGVTLEEKYYDYMLSYSPYDQVEVKKYPNLLVTSGFFDSQVQYFEPLNGLRSLGNIGKGKINYFYIWKWMLVMEVNLAGSGGKEVALEYAFC